MPRDRLDALSNGSKPWKYVLIPHDVITENMTLAGLRSQFAENLEMFESHRACKEITERVCTNATFNQEPLS